MLNMRQFMYDCMRGQVQAMCLEISVSGGLHVSGNITMH
jgi:hypothetical protein